tara:strand:+ start:6383 stop:7321 length:939 start_codon:yes stop_codon:yes gene_type:complete
MITLSKHLFISFLTAKNLSKNKGLKKFFEIFVIRFLYAFDFIRNFLNSKNNDQLNILSQNYFKKDITSDEVLKDLNSVGYNNFLTLKENYIDLIKQEISLKNSSVSFKGKKKFFEYQKNLNDTDNLDIIFKKSQDLEIPHVALDIDLSKTKFIKELATSEFFMNLSKRYINAQKISISGQCYLSNPINSSESEKKDNAQYYHYDNDFKKFFKVFVYLSDVNSSAGPHSFVSKTNIKKCFKHIIAERIDDKEIKKFYDLNDIRIFSGEKGHVIIEDTFGLHKGSSPTKESRIVLILIYGHGLGIENYKNYLIK